MNSRTIAAKLGSKLNIPSLPEVVQRLNTMIDRGDARMAEVGSVLALDPPFAAKALRVANSAYYALQVPVSSIEHAASILGMRSLKSMAMQALVLDLFRNLEAIPGFQPRRVWNRAVVASRLAVDLPRNRLGGISSEEVQLCGLLHDIGEFVMFDHFGETYVRLREQVDATGDDLVTVERDELGTSHTEVGRLVAMRWSLPKSVVRVAEHHHDLDGVAAKDPLVAHVAYCDAILDALSCGRITDPDKSWLPDGPRKLLDYRPSELDPVLRRARELWAAPH